MVREEQRINQSERVSRFQDGDVVLLRDQRGRRYRLKLRSDAAFFTHLGALDHNSIIGSTDGSYLETTKGHRFIALRPTLLEAILEIPRQSQVIYPKDLASILMRGDIFPGANVVEIGLGSGATAAGLLRAIGPSGHLVSYEIRENIIERAKQNIEEMSPGYKNHKIAIRDAYEEGIVETNVDRIVTDVPEPWKLIESAAKALKPGGVFIAFVPTALQIHDLGIALIHDPHFQLIESMELLERRWHISHNSTRPDHRMVGHSGFITTARRCEPPTN